MTPLQEAVRLVLSIVLNCQAAVAPVPTRTPPPTATAVAPTPWPTLTPKPPTLAPTPRPTLTPKPKVTPKPPPRPSLHFTYGYLGAIPAPKSGIAKHYYQGIMEQVLRNRGMAWKKDVAGYAAVTDCS